MCCLCTNCVGHCVHIIISRRPPALGAEATLFQGYVHVRTGTFQPILKDTRNVHHTNDVITIACTSEPWLVSGKIEGERGHKNPLEHHGLLLLCLKSSILHAYRNMGEYIVCSKDSLLLKYAQSCSHLNV